MHRYQMDALAKQIGGVYYHYELKEQGQDPDGLKPVRAENQKTRTRVFWLSR